MTITTNRRWDERVRSSSIVLRCVCSVLSILMVWAGLPFVVCLCPRRNNEHSCCSTAKVQTAKRYAHVYCCCCEALQASQQQSADQSIRAACQFAKNSAITALPPILATFAVDLHIGIELSIALPMAATSLRDLIGADKFDSGPPPIDVVIAYGRLVI